MAVAAFVLEYCIESNIGGGSRSPYWLKQAARNRPHFSHRAKAQHLFFGRNPQRRQGK